MNTGANTRIHMFGTNIQSGTQNVTMLAGQTGGSHGITGPENTYIRGFIKCQGEMCFPVISNRHHYTKEQCFVYPVISTFYLGFTISFSAYACVIAE